MAGGEDLAPGGQVNRGGCLLGSEATKEMGLRGFISGVVFDMLPELLSQVEPFIQRWKDDELIRPAVGPHAAYTCSEETLLRAGEIADRHQAMVHMHISETKPGQKPGGVSGLARPFE